MGVIATIEAAILAQVQTSLGATVKVKESLAGSWTLDMLRNAIQKAPGVYVAFLNGRGVPGRDGYVGGSWMVYAVTKGPAEPLRRQGTPRVIGAYEIVERLVPVLSGLKVVGVGTLGVTNVDNLFKEATFELGGTVYGIALTLPNMPMTYQQDLASLAPFLLFHAEHSLVAGEAEPAATPAAQRLGLSLRDPTAAERRNLRIEGGVWVAAASGAAARAGLRPPWPRPIDLASSERALA